LPLREAGPHHIGRALDDARCGRQHEDGWDFGFRHQRRDRKHGRRDAASEEVDLLVDNQFLRQSLGNIRHRSIIFDDQLNLTSGNHVTMLF